MFFSFFNRSSAKAPGIPHDTTRQPTAFKKLCEKEGGAFFSDFKLFHRDTHTRIDLLLFLPHHGVYVGEKIGWTIDELKGASVERSSRRSKKAPATGLEGTQSKIHRKLEDVLSFDSTASERFFWMERLSEEEFDTLDPSFHALLPKSHLVFCDEGETSLREKLEALLPRRSEPYSPVKVIGSLNSHTLLLPTPDAPFGMLLDDEQTRFVCQEAQSGILSLCGDYGSGKSTALIRKALHLLLHDPSGKLLIITPTLLGGELLRNEFVSVLEYGVLDVDLSRLLFFPYDPALAIENLKLFQEASALLCDDAYLMDELFIEKLKALRGNRPLILSTIQEPDPDGEAAILHHRYRNIPEPKRLTCSDEQLMSTLLIELKARLADVSEKEVMLIFPENEPLLPYKEALNEYFGISCQMLTPDFSLQYGNLDHLLVASSDALSGISIPHLYLVIREETADYSYPLSRASETATIICVSNPPGETDEQNHQE